MMACEKILSCIQDQSVKHVVACLADTPHRCVGTRRVPHHDTMSTFGATVADNMGESRIQGFVPQCVGLVKSCLEVQSSPPGA